MFKNRTKDKEFCMKKSKITNNIYNVCGKNIKKIRKEQKVTQDELCARMQVMGYQISRSDISKLENGKKFITDFEIVGFSKALKVSILDLFE